VEGADDDTAQAVTYRHTANKSAALVRGRLHTGHRPHRQPVVRRVPVSSSLQDSAGAAAAEATRPGQGADVQLPTDIESHDSFKGDRAAGAGQTEASSASIAELVTSIVSLPVRSFNGNGTTARHEQCVRS